MSKEIDDGLTDEERAALSEDDGGDVEQNNDAEGDGGDDGQSTEGAEDSPKAGSDDASDEAKPEAKPDPVAGTGDAGATAEAQPQSAPILVAQVPENVEARLAEITAQKSVLLDQFDNGDITAREYQTQLDALSKNERQIELQQYRAELAGDMETQRRKNEWDQTCHDFMSKNTIYKDRPELHKEIDQEVRFLAAKPENESWSGQKFLEEAHKRVMLLNGIAAPATTPVRPPKTPVDLPPNLAKIPAADVEDTNGGRFAVLDRLANSDPIAFEETLNKMSASERDAYLAA